MDGIINFSGSDGGYGDYTNLSADVQLGQSYDIFLEPAFTATVYNELWFIYIDWNQNFVFDAGELVFQSGTASSTLVTGTINVPTDALLGSTRMRIVMGWDGNNPAPTACGTYQFGETEDYTLNIFDGPCLTYSNGGGPYNVFDAADPGVACDVGTVECAPFQAWANESYSFTPVAQNTYEWNFCNDCNGNPLFDSSLWGGEPIITIGNDIDSDGFMETLIATNVGCSITFTAPSDDPIILHVSVSGNCGASELQIDNGFPTVTVLGGGNCGTCGDGTCGGGEDYCSCFGDCNCSAESTPLFVYIDGDGIFQGTPNLFEIDPVTDQGPLFCNDFITGGVNDGNQILLGIGIFGPSCVGSTTNPWNVVTSQGTLTIDGSTAVTTVENATVYYLSITQAEIDASGGATFIYFENPTDPDCLVEMIVAWADLGNSSTLANDFCPATTNCPNSIIVNDPVAPANISGFHEADQYIEWSGGVTGDSTTTFHANDYVELQAEFDVPANTQFTIDIQPCGTAPLPKPINEDGILRQEMKKD